MVLPLYLALTAAEISASSAIPDYCAYMACHFSPYTAGISNIPAFLPRGSMLILNDRLPCQGHSADLVANQISEAVLRLDCESVLLDFQRSPEPESEAIVKKIVAELPCPVTVTEGFAKELDCPVFLSPAPLHLPLADYLLPWKGREIWLEAALCQEEIRITRNGTSFRPIFPTDRLAGGFPEAHLHCRYLTETRADAITFTLFDTLETLDAKLEQAHRHGVTRAVGLWQELARF